MLLFRASAGEAGSAGRGSEGIPSLLFYAFQAQTLHAHADQRVAHSLDIGRFMHALIPVDVEGVAHLRHLHHDAIFGHDMEGRHTDVRLQSGRMIRYLARKDGERDELTDPDADRK